MKLPKRIFPVVFVWREVQVVDADGVIVRRKVMDPLMRYDNVASRQYELDEEYILVPLEARSRRSHNHYFAALHDAFENLPEGLAARWPTAEHMRKWLLVEKGWCEEEEFLFEGPHAEEYARRQASFARKADIYARISIHQIANDKWTVIVRTAVSQSANAMGKEAFDASKKDVLEELEHMIGVAKGELSRHAGAAS